MNAYPIANDLFVKWSLRYADGSVFPLHLYEVELSYSTNRGTKVVSDTATISVEDNVLTWRFAGEDQAVSGRYSLKLKISQNGLPKAEFVQTDAFALTPLAGFKGVGTVVHLTSYANDELESKLLYESLKVDIEDLGNGLGETNRLIGNPSSLVTPTKTNLVSAINEAYNHGGGGGGGGSVVADNEDLVAVGDVLKFKDRLAINGMGYIILRSDKSFEEQVILPNTIYEVRYKFTLTDAFEMPSNCVLLFNGGLLRNGTLVGNSTRVDASKVHIFEGMTFEGHFNITSIYPEWFGATSYHYKNTNATTEATHSVYENIPSAIDNLGDSADAFNKSLEFSSLTGAEVILCGSIYRIDSKVTFPMKSTMVTQSDTIIVPYMEGSGDVVITQDESTQEFSTEQKSEPIYTMKANQLLDKSAMAIAFEMCPVKTRFIGGGCITLTKSRYTIGINCLSSTYHYMDMTYMSPEIDVTVVGDLMKAYAPDSRDYVGDGYPSDSIGAGETSTIYYWDKLNKRYYSRQSGSSWEELSRRADPLWNTALRFDVYHIETGQCRIVNPQLNFKGMHGARGIEVYVREGTSWFNQSILKGSLTGYYSNYISVFCGKEQNFDIHDWRDLVIQASANSMYDSSIFYAIRCGNIALGMVWDYNVLGSRWQHPFYFGVGTNGISISAAKSADVVDLGKNNIYSGSLLGNSNFFVKTYDTLTSLGYTNVLKYRSQRSVGYNNTNNDHFGYLSIIPSNEEDIVNSLYVADNNHKTPALLYDEDMSTSIHAVDTSNGVYGIAMCINGSVGNNEWSTRSRNTPYLCIDCGINKNTQNVMVGYIHGGKFTYLKPLYVKKSDSSGTHYPIEHVMIPVSSKPTKDTLVIFASVEEAVTVSLYNVKFMGTTPLTLNPEHGSTVNRPDSCPKGHVYYDETLGMQVVNAGDSSNVVWKSLDGKKDIQHGTDSTSLAIIPNVLHVWDEVGTLNLTLAEGTSADEYMFQFTSGDIPTVLSLPSTIKWIGDHDVESGKTYQVSIVNNAAVMGGF